MKKLTIFLLAMSIFLGCDPHSEQIPVTSPVDTVLPPTDSVPSGEVLPPDSIISPQDTILPPVDTLIIPPSDSLDTTALRKGFCYEVQMVMQIGKPSGHYMCMEYDSTYGFDFQSAYNKLEPHINELLEFFYEVNIGPHNPDIKKAEAKLTKCNVLNPVKKDLEFISVDAFAYWTTENKYIYLGYCYVIDSEGNAYRRVSEDD